MNDEIILEGNATGLVQYLQQYLDVRDYFDPNFISDLCDRVLKKGDVNFPSDRKTDLEGGFVRLRANIEKCKTVEVRQSESPPENLSLLFRVSGAYKNVF
jgi:hypothetical protein